MAADFAPIRRTCGALPLVLLLYAAVAHAEPEAKPQPLITSGPAVALSPRQQLDLRLKRETDPGARAPLAAESRAIKQGSPPPRLVATDTPPSNADPAPKVAGWRNVAHALGPLPRASWTTPWFLRKPADRTVSRPLTPDEAARRGSDQAEVRR